MPRSIAIGKNVTAPAKSTIIDLILKSSLELIGHYGYALGTLDKIAAHAQLTRGTVSYYFPQKEILLLSTAQHASELIDQYIWSKLNGQTLLTSTQLNDILSLSKEPRILISAHLFMMRLTLDLAALKSDNNYKKKRNELFKVLAHYHRRWHEIIKKLFSTTNDHKILEEKVNEMLLTLNDKVFNETLQSSILEINLLANFIA